MLQGHYLLKACAICFTLSAFACARSNMSGKGQTPSRANVEIHLTHISPYCGGARPTHGLLEKASEILPLANKKFYVVEGEENFPGKSKIICSGVTNDSGYAYIHLPRGKFGVVFEDKVDFKAFNEMMRLYAIPTENYSPIDSVCLKKWLRECELTMDIQKDTEYSFSLLVHDKCPWNQLPCITYTGPLPP